MTDCRDAERLISRQLDGELPVDLRRRLESHLERCADCQELVVDERARSEDLRAALTPGRASVSGLEEDLAARLAALELPAALPGRWSASTRRRMTAMSCAASFMIGVGLWFVSPWSGGTVPDGIDELNRSPGSPASSPIFVIQEHSDGADLIPGLDGPPRRVRTHRSRTLITDMPAAEKGDPAAEPDLILEMEERLIRYASDSWH